MWGHHRPGCSIRILCDNAAVVAILRAGISKDALVMHLMRCLSFFIARFQLVLIPKHLPGRENSAADRLSRDALSSFRQLVPQSRPEPMQLPGHLMEALVYQRPDCVLLFPGFSIIIAEDLQVRGKPLQQVLSFDWGYTPSSGGTHTLQVCVILSGQEIDASHYKDILVRGEVPSDKVGLC